MTETVVVELDIRRDGRDMTVYVDSVVEYHEECCYGEDADGNRGIRWTYVDDVKGIYAADNFNDHILLTDEEAQRASELLVQQFLEG